MKHRSFAVIGLGAFGGTVAQELARFGNPVLGIDVNERTVSTYADELSEAVIADGRDEAALREAGVGHVDVAVVAIGEDLEANILCTMNVKMLGVKVIWAKAFNRMHHRILSKLGADRVIRPEQEVGIQVAQALHNPLVRDYVSLGNGYNVVDISAPAGIEGRSCDDPDLFEAHQLRLLGMMREGGFHAPGCGVALKEGDKLLLLGKRPELRAFAEDMRGEV